MRRVVIRRALVGVVGVVTSAALVAPVQATALDEVNTSALRRGVTVSGILAHERAFQSIANDNDGTRASGTPGYDASVAYVTRKLRAAGYSVRQQEFTFPFFRELAPAELSQVTPTPTDYETATFDYSGSGEVTGTVTPIDVVIPASATPSSTSGCQAVDFPAVGTGPAVALVQRGTCTFETKVDNAVAAGYDAVVIFNEGQPGRQDLFAGTLGNPKTVPVVGLSYADAVSLYQATQAGPVTARVFTSTEFDPDRKTKNVIATSTTGNPDEAVVVGAHLDSVIEGPGINDNGSGSAAILEIAEEMSELKLTGRLRRQVRFAFWGAEELGLLGSQYYVDNLSESQLSRIYANLNFDMVGSPNYVRFVYDGDGSDSKPAGPPGSDAIEDLFTDYFDGEGLASEPTEFSGRSDYGPFIAKGVPAGGLFSGAEGIKTPAQAATYGGTAGEPYDACYHQACDTITNLNVDALDELGDAAAHAVYTLGRSRSGLFPDGSLSTAKAKAGSKVKVEQTGHAVAR